MALPQLTDPLTDALYFLRMSASLYCRSEFTAPWALVLPPLQGFLMLHVITAGEAWLEIKGEPDRLLKPGVLALVPHGGGHKLASESGLAGEKLFDIRREEVTERYEILRIGGGGTLTTAVCGVLQFDHPAAQQVIRMLPKALIVDAGSSSENDWVMDTVRAIESEAVTLRPGGEMILARLADVLVIHVIRSWMAEDPAAQKGWLGALQDRQIGRAIAQIHLGPQRDWTVESLAAEAAMSRSAFAARFTDLVGEPAMRYVTRWRMHTAFTLLKEGDGPVADIADRLGYESEAAFSRAFKRYVGISPGLARRKAAPLPMI